MVYIYIVYTLSSLEPGQEYFYVIGDNYGWSQEFSFRAPPSFNQTFAVVAFGGELCVFACCRSEYIHGLAIAVSIIHGSKQCMYLDVCSYNTGSPY